MTVITLGHHLSPMVIGVRYVMLFMILVEIHCIDFIEFRENLLVHFLMWCQTLAN